MGDLTDAEDWGSSLIQSEPPLCESLRSDHCFRHGHHPQDDGLLMGKYCGGRVNRAEIKLVTLPK